MKNLLGVLEIIVALLAIWNEVTEMKLKDLDILRVGHDIQIAGAIFADNDTLFLCLLPEESAGGREIVSLEMNTDDWKAFIRQTDLLEVEALAKDPNGNLIKTILRKSERQVDQGVSWRVYKRDGYSCRYCGADDVPLTVDHLITWETGGPSIEANLTSCCRKCNKVRGNLPYADWLQHPHYLKVSKNLTEGQRKQNQDLLATLDRIPRNIRVKSR